MKVETSIIGVKLESNYYPGSVTNSGTVQIPTRKTLRWLLTQAGFKILEINPGWNENHLSDSLSFSHRKNADSTIILALRNNQEIQQKELLVQHSISEVERIFTWGVLDEDILKLTEELVLDNPEPYNSTLKKSLADLGKNLDYHEQKVLNALIHHPVAKLNFEQAKLKLHLGFKNDAIKMFKNIVTNLSGDWRSTYRSFFILANLDDTNRATWLKFGQRFNPEFPLKSIENKTFYLSSFIKVK